MLKVAIIGLERYQSPWQAILETHNGKLVAVCDSDEEKERGLSGIFYTDVAVMLAAED